MWCCIDSHFLLQQIKRLGSENKKLKARIRELEMSTARLTINAPTPTILDVTPSKLTTPDKSVASSDMSSSAQTSIDGDRTDTTTPDQIDAGDTIGGGIESGGIHSTLEYVLRNTSAFFEVSPTPERGAASIVNVSGDNTDAEASGVACSE